MTQDNDIRTEDGMPVAAGSMDTASPSANEQQIFAAALAESQQRFLEAALAEDGLPISAGWLPAPSASKPTADSLCNSARAG